MNSSRKPQFSPAFLRTSRMHAISVTFTEKSTEGGQDFPWRKQRRKAGRMGEVGPPASGCSFFTFPYSRLGALNRNPALRGWLATASHKRRTQ